MVINSIDIHSNVVGAPFRGPGDQLLLIYTVVE